jgi:hypothetical protein
MEEEGARRRAYKGRDGAGRDGFLQNLNEEDEEEDEEVLPPVVQARIRQQQDRLSDGRAGQRDQPRQRRQANKFELTMDGATLLDRRHKRGGQMHNPANPSPLARNAMSEADTVDAPQSPMHF